MTEEQQRIFNLAKEYVKENTFHDIDNVMYDAFIAGYVAAMGRYSEVKESMYNWLWQYREELKSTNVFHKNEGIINSIDRVLPK